MTKIICDYCGKSYNVVPGLKALPLTYGLRDNDREYDFCSSVCRVTWMDERGELADRTSVADNLIEALG